MDRLKTRTDFLRAQKGQRRVFKTVTLETCPSPESVSGFRVGFTATRKIGGAVMRNRAKRRLRAAAAATLPLLGRAGHDYVLVARADTLTCGFDRLVRDLSAALGAVHKQTEKAASPGGQT